jgi:hypothetical protein
MGVSKAFFSNIYIDEYPHDISYTLWLFNIAMENCPFKQDGLPIKNGDFPWLC